MFAKSGSTQKSFCRFSLACLKFILWFYFERGIDEFVRNRFEDNRKSENKEPAWVQFSAVEVFHGEYSLAQSN